MVMTSQLSPRLSARGFVLAGAVALGAYLASPIWACPPEEKRVAKDKPDAPAPSYKVLVPAPPTPPRAPRAPRAPEAPRPGTRPAPDAGVTTFEQFMHDRHDRDGMPMEDRIRDLERQIELLHRQLEQLQSPRSGVGSGEGTSGGGGAGAAGPRANMVTDFAPFAAAVAGFGAGAPPSVDDVNCLGAAAAMGGPTVVRTYTLSGGKAEALGALMSRSDVPINVRTGGDAIEVHASPAQHCIFEMFCKLIDGGDRVEAHVLPEGKLEALTELMVRSDVHILVEPDGNEIRVHGTDVEQAVFDAFCRLIHPTGVAVTARSAPEAYLIASDRAQAYEANANVQVQYITALRQQLHSMETQLRNLERQGERKADRAEDLANKADEADDEGDSLREEAQGSGLVRSRSAMAKAESLRARSLEYRAQAQALEIEAEHLERQAEEIQNVIEQLESQIEDIEEAAEDDED